jgi:hypothetical protein
MAEVCFRQERGKSRPTLRLTCSHKTPNLLPRRYP